MKLLYFLFSIALLIGSCKEEPPNIPSTPPPGERKVLMEEFSGANCVPCAAGKAEIDNLLEIYQDNLIVVTIHSTSFAGSGDPVVGAKYDFRVEEGAELVSLLGKPAGVPTGYINRTLFEGEDDRALLRQQWAGFVVQEVEKIPEIGLNLTTTFNEVTRELTMNVAMVPVEDISGDIRLTMLITENELIDKQETSEGRVDDYQHDHILRKIISSINGDKITDALTKGKKKKKRYTFTIPSDEEGWWVANNCNVVAFVSRFDGDNLSILQADEVHLGD